MKKILRLSAVATLLATALVAGPAVLKDAPGLEHAPPVAAAVDAAVPDAAAAIGVCNSWKSVLSFTVYTSAGDTWTAQRWDPYRCVLDVDVAGSPNGLFIRSGYRGVSGTKCYSGGRHHSVPWYAFPEVNVQKGYC